MVSVREVGHGDLGRLAEFLADNAQPRFSTEEFSTCFDLWWMKNPYFKDGDIFGWIIADDECEDYVKGFLGNIPIDYRHNDSIFYASCPTTWCVDPKYKKHAIYLFYAMLSQKKDIFVNATPSPVSRQIFLEFGFVDIAGRQKTFIRPLTYRIFEHVLAKKLKYRSISHVLAIIMFFFANKFIRLLENLFSSERTYEIAEAHDSHQIADIQRKSGNLYLDNMEWILRNDREKKLFIIRDSAGQSGYALIHYVKNRTNKLSYLQIIDYFNLNSIALNALRKEILGSFGGRTIDFILITHANAPSMEYLKSGFLDITNFMPSVCLVYGDKVKNLGDAQVTAIFGDRSFIMI